MAVFRLSLVCVCVTSEKGPPAPPLTESETTKAKGEQPFLTAHLLPGSGQAPRNRADVRVHAEGRRATSAPHQKTWYRGTGPREEAAFRVERDQEDDENVPRPTSCRSSIR